MENTPGFHSQQQRDVSELAERRACASVEPRAPSRQASSLGMLSTRLAAVIRAWAARDESAVRDELRQLADEALLLARTDPLFRR